MKILSMLAKVSPISLYYVITDFDCVNYSNQLHEIEPSSLYQT